MVKLECEQYFLNGCLEDYKEKHNDIYYRLENIAKCKYLKGIGVKEFQEQFFIDFIINGESYNNYRNLYHYKSHKRLLNLRRKIDPDFLQGFEL
jgi:hypothetical protein